MAVTLRLRSPAEIPVEVEGVVPELLAGLAPDSIGAFPISQGNSRLRVGDLFEVSGDCRDDLTLVWEGDLKAVKRIGQGLKSGRVIVRGNAGMHVGAEMSGGVIEVLGDVSDWAGAEMSGGRLQVQGSVGDCLGGAYRGSRRGMTGGEILVTGNAGSEAGRVMRRGLIAIGGDCGEFCGSRMIAGTILIGGAARRCPGAGMKRGTIGLFGPSVPEMLPTFRLAGRFGFPFLRAYASRLREGGLNLLADRMSGEVERWCGDCLTRGLGEILRPVSRS